MLMYQDKILKFFDDKSVIDIPHTLALVGDKGCGKHTLANHLASTYDIPLQNMTESLTLDAISNMQIATTPSFYYIDVDDISEKEQNMILKILEEPSSNVYLLLLMNSESNVLTTVLNRCSKIVFSPYTKDQLRSFTQDQHILEIATTPGEVKELESNHIIEMESLADKIFSFINRASFANCLVLPRKLKYKNNDEGFDCDLFFRILLSKAVKQSKERYLLTSKLVNDCRIANIDKQKLFENYLLKLRKV